MLTAMLSMDLPLAAGHTAGVSQRITATTFACFPCSLLFYESKPAAGPEQRPSATTKEQYILYGGALSGTKRKMRLSQTRVRAAKKMNTPYFMEHSMVRKACRAKPGQLSSQNTLKTCPGNVQQQELLHSLPHNLAGATRTHLADDESHEHCRAQQPVSVSCANTLKRPGCTGQLQILLSHEQTCAGPHC